MIKSKLVLLVAISILSCVIILRGFAGCGASSLRDDIVEPWCPDLPDFDGEQQRRPSHVSYGSSAQSAYEEEEEFEQVDSPRTYPSLDELLMQAENSVNKSGKIDLKRQISDYSDLEYILQEFTGDKRINRIYLTENKLERLPEAIGTFTKLVQLKASHNKLTNLPKSFKNLLNLRRLWLGGNQLSERALKIICKLPCLEWLDLSCNDLITLPVEIRNLKTLQKLDITGNLLNEAQVRRQVGDSVVIINGDVPFTFRQGEEEAIEAIEDAAF